MNTMTEEWFTAISKKLMWMYDTTNPVQRKKVQSTIFELLRSVQDYGIFMMYMEQAAIVFGTSVQPLVKQYKQYISAKKMPAYKKPQDTKPEVDRAMLVASLFYDWFLQKSKYTSEIIIQRWELKHDKVIHSIEWYLTKYVHDIKRVVLKHPSVTAEEKRVVMSI